MKREVFAAIMSKLLRRYGLALAADPVPSLHFLMYTRAQRSKWPRRKSRVVLGIDTVELALCMTFFHSNKKALYSSYKPDWPFSFGDSMFNHGPERNRLLQIEFTVHGCLQRTMTLLCLSVSAVSLALKKDPATHVATDDLLRQVFKFDITIWGRSWHGEMGFLDKTCSE